MKTYLVGFLFLIAAAIVLGINLHKPVPSPIPYETFLTKLEEQIKESSPEERKTIFKNLEKNQEFLDKYPALENDLAFLSLKSLPESEWSDRAKELDARLKKSPVSEDQSNMAKESISTILKAVAPEKRSQTLSDLLYRDAIARQIPNIEQDLRREFNITGVRLTPRGLIDNYNQRLSHLSPKEKKDMINKIKQTNIMFKEYPNLEKELSR